MILRLGARGRAPMLSRAMLASPLSHSLSLCTSPLPLRTSLLSPPPSAPRALPMAPLPTLTPPPASGASPGAAKLSPSPTVR